MIPAFIVHDPSNVEREPFVAAVQAKVPHVQRQDAIMLENRVRGCSLSQKAIVWKAAAFGWKSVWIMEDDCVLSPDFDLAAFEQQVELAFERGVSIVVGGSANGQEPSMSPLSAHGLVRVERFSSCHCWVAHQRAFQGILELNPDRPIDMEVSTLALEKAIVVPFVAMQAPSESSIERMYKDYTLWFHAAEACLKGYVTS